MNPDKIRETKKSVVNTTDWTNIPYYPTNREKRINVAKYLVSLGKQIPENLLRQLAEDQQKEIEEDAYNKFSGNQIEEEPRAPPPQPHPHPHQSYPYPHQSHAYQMQNRNSTHAPQPPPKFSPFYANYVGQKPRAQATARVKLGGVY
jgi:hypothetical protein